MIKFRYLLYLLIGIPVFIILIWYFAVPNDLITTLIEDSISNQSKQNASAQINGLKKGLLFTVYADSIELKIDKTPALIITGISTRMNPFSILKKQFTFSLKGKIGTGDITGSFSLPEGGILKIEGAELNAIPYLASAGLEGSGLITANLVLKDNTVDINFKIPDAEIHGLVQGMPLPISSFRTIQGALYLRENTIMITSINLEADKGFARLKGEITDGFMDLILEIMPSAGELNTLESMLIGRYLVSPGYYVIPIEGPVM